mmetsp:Transcript_32113/g.74838  ORF Transcript_32113/g.74838 Transcript_32113/m.74838 type:complete len:201 (-) Transcript_32113:111-713(-)
MLRTEEAASLVKGRVKRLNALTPACSKLAKIIMARRARLYCRGQCPARWRCQCLPSKEVSKVPAVQVAKQSAAIVCCIGGCCGLDSCNVRTRRIRSLIARGPLDHIGEIGCQRGLAPERGPIDVPELGDGGRGGGVKGALHRSVDVSHRRSKTGVALHRSERCGCAEPKCCHVMTRAQRAVKALGKAALVGYRQLQDPAR